MPVIPSLPNLRDVGGHRTRAGGRVRTGLLYRSGGLNRLDDADMATFARLRVRTVYDLRSRPERDAQPDRLPPATAYVVVDVIEGWGPGTPGQVFEMLRTPETAREALAGGKGEAMWLQQYRNFVLLEGARTAFGRLFDGIAAASNRPALFHCSTGKDRTGWAAAALLMLLGVPAETVMDDYLLSARYLGPMVGPVYEEFAARGIDPEFLRPIMAVTPAYLEAGRVELLRCFGSVEAYFAEGLGVDAATQRALREAFVERP